MSKQYPIFLTEKALKQTILALRSANRSTEREREYLRLLVASLDRQLEAIKASRAAEVVEKIEAFRKTKSKGRK